MPTNLRRTAAAAAALALSASLAACTNADGGTGSNGDLTYEDSPLNAYFQLFSTIGDMSDEELQAYHDQRSRRQEDLIAQCMADQGFDFNAEGSGDQVQVGRDEGEDEDREGPQWGTIEYAEQYGYDVFIREEQPLIESEGEWVDPNAELLEGMSDAERTAWEEALWGAPSEGEHDLEADPEEVEWSWEDQGCTGWAQHEVDQDDPDAGLRTLREDPRFSDLFKQLDSMSERVQSDPRMTELHEEWASCMAVAGYSFDRPADAQISIYRLQESMWDGDDDTESGEPDQALVEEYKDLEITTAVADVTCQEEIGLQEEGLQIRFAIEQEFIDANKDALAEFATAVETAVSTP
ncbi:hypothetical protein [Salana multivorans]